MAFSLICFILILSQFFKPIRNIFLLLPSIFITLITWQCGQTTEIYTRMSYVNLLIGFLAVIVVSERISFDVRFLGKFMALFILANSTFLMCQIFGITNYLITDVYPNATGFLQFPWVMGVVATLSIPLIWAFSPICIIATLPMIFYSHSLICAAVAFISVLYLSVGTKSFFILMGLGIAAIVLFLLFSDRNIDEHRFIIWKKAIFYSKDQIMGNGLGTWAHKGFRRDVNGANMWWRWAHNEPYQVMFETGISGLALMLAYLSRLFTVSHRSLKCFLAGMFVLSLFHPIFHSGKLAVFILIGIALVESTRKQFNFIEFKKNHIVGDAS